MKNSDAFVIIHELKKQQRISMLNNRGRRWENEYLKKQYFPREYEVMLIKEIRESYKSILDIWNSDGLDFDDDGFSEAVLLVEGELRIKIETLQAKRKELLKNQNSNDYKSVFNELISAGVIKEKHKPQILKLIEKGRISPKIPWMESDWMLGLLMEYIIRHTKLELLPNQDLSDFISLNFEDESGNEFVNINQNLKRAKKTDVNGDIINYKFKVFSTKLDLAFNK